MLLPPSGPIRPVGRGPATRAAKRRGHALLLTGPLILLLTACAPAFVGQPFQFGGTFQGLSWREGAPLTLRLDQRGRTLNGSLETAYHLQDDGTRVSPAYRGRITGEVVEENLARLRIEMVRAFDGLTIQSGEVVAYRRGDRLVVEVWSALVGGVEQRARRGPLFTFSAVRDQPLPGRHAPRILGVHFPARIPADGTRVGGRIGFHDPDGDVQLVRVTVVRGDFRGFSFVPEVIGQSRGEIGFNLFATRSQTVRLQVVLSDATGRESAPFAFEFRAE